jgi:hypothetical protein
MKKLILLMAFLFGANLAYGQDQTIEKPEQKKDNFRFGFTFLNVWSNVKGNTPESFNKPSLGANLKVEYYPLDFLGLTAGVGYQQRGYGVILPDTGLVAPSINTFRNRIRTNSVEFPVGLILRTPMLAGGTTRVTGTIGVSPLYTFQVNDAYLNIESGFHVITDVTESFSSRDAPLYVSIGPEIDTSAGFLQVQLVASFGTADVYSQVNNPKNYSGKHRYFGVSMGCTF